MRKRGKLLIIWVSLLVFTVLITSCQSLVPGDQEPDQEVVQTSAAQTLTALQTQTAASEPTETEPTEAQLTPTPEPTPTSAPTNAPMPTATPEAQNDVDNEEDFVVYQFAENICQAGWESDVEEDIPCPSKENIDQGFVQPVNYADLEDGNTYEEPAMLTYPNAGRGGYMVGRYPDLLIEEGDHFRSFIGCRAGTASCDVRFTLRVAVTGESFDNLGSWREINDSQVYPIDVDLSDYAGEEVEIVLSTIAADDTDENFAMWAHPRVVRNADRVEDPETDKICNWAEFINDVTIDDRTVLEENKEAKP